MKNYSNNQKYTSSKLSVFKSREAIEKIKKLQKRTEENLYLMAGSVILYIIMIVTSAYQIA
jgi:hypothetical protein